VECSSGDKGGGGERIKNRVRARGQTRGEADSISCFGSGIRQKGGKTKSTEGVVGEGGQVS